MRRAVILTLLALAGPLTACQRDAQDTAVQSGDVITLRREVSPPQPQVSADLAARGADGCLLGAPPVPKAPPPPLPLTGTLGLWVAEVDPATLQPLRAVGTNPDSLFPLASTYKQAVLWAVLRAVDAGTLRPSERFDVTRDNQSLGSYPFDGSSVRTLAERMIRNSDNTATDILHRRVGLQAVQDVADELGLCRTRLIMPTRDWWVMQAGLSRTFSGTGRWATATGAERERLAQLIDTDARAYRADYLQRRLDGYFDHHYDPALDLITHNVSTPYEFGTLLAAEFLRGGLSGASQRWQRQVMALGYGKSALTLTHRGGVAYFGGKGGNGWRLLTYSGYVETTDGRHLVYAFMQRDAAQTYTMPNTRRAFAWINAGIQAVLDAPERPPEAGPTPP
ncbi:serine hydrolase [Deinococcus seoulensis]|uniref:Serine hydrolase n=1 Tax=Deinococcus seoulensis TaxID=1837379 RepID=A0ABQ2RP96_9DEIO|nr:serine hydrolase [Deinococcus seoulensis]GGR43960.1 serine hydrolase [Deinococcus seoulensis]